VVSLSNQLALLSLGGLALRKKRWLQIYTNPPQPVPGKLGHPQYYGVKLDVGRLCVQCAIVTVATGGLILTLRDRKKA
jgi:hypothetical protein